MSRSSYLMFVGSYTDFDILAHLPLNEETGEGVYCFHFDNGEIRPLATVASLNPAVLSFHPSDARTLYVLEEGIESNGMISKIEYSYACAQKKGAARVASVTIDDHDANHQQTNGKSLCYFKVDPVGQQYAVAVNYWDGHIDVYRMNGKAIAGLHKHIDGMQMCGEARERRQVADREDHWKHRQAGPHAHSVHFYRHWVFVPDLGENAIHQFAWRPRDGVIMQYEERVSLPEGSGPRHLVFHPRMKVAYVSNELASSICVLSIDDSEPSLRKRRLCVIQTVNTDKDMHDCADIWKRNYVAEIGISNDGRFIYCSNRGYDTIAIFRVLQADGGRLEPLDYVSTFGKTPRHFSITPDDEWLVGANQDSNNLVAFKRDRDTGALTFVAKYEHPRFAAPNYVLFVPHAVGEDTVQKDTVSRSVATQKCTYTMSEAPKGRETGVAQRVLAPAVVMAVVLSVLFALMVQILT